jgi:hypothetical protein
VLITAACFILAGAAMAAGGTFWVFLVIFWLTGVALALALHRAGLTISGDVLTYRIPLHTRAWHRAEIAAFWLEKPWWSHGTTAHIGMSTVTGETVRFWAVDASLLFDNDVLDRWLATLQHWLGAADEPSLN